MKTVIEMARDAGFPERRAFSDLSDLYPRLKRFAELVAAAEREACAKVCETEWSNVAERIYGEECAAAIRARSNT